MFVAGGPAYSGTTLLALLLNQGDLVCLDEPDFEKPAQRHRGVAFLRRLFPDHALPPEPTTGLDYEQAFTLARACERAIAPKVLGLKTCDWPFLAFADLARRERAPVIAIVRDIRDALVRPLPEWLTEASLNQRYRMIWERRDSFDVLLRYEDLVSDPELACRRLSAALGHPVYARTRWNAAEVHAPMLKAERHRLLLSGQISAERIGIWRRQAHAYSAETHETARWMGYE